MILTGRSTLTYEKEPIGTTNRMRHHSYNCAWNRASRTRKKKWGNKHTLHPRSDLNQTWGGEKRIKDIRRRDGAPKLSGISHEKPKGSQKKIGGGYR